MHYGNIKPFTIENGEGVRVSLFVSGCRNNCPHCFQKQTWDFNYGNEYTQKTEDDVIEMLKHNRVDGLTVLGGEPFEPENQESVLKLIQRAKSECPDKTIWIYTGCILEKDIQTGRCFVKGITDKILKIVDVIVDGPFVEELKNLSLPFRGSSNQRILYRGKDFDMKIDISTYWYHGSANGKLDKIHKPSVKHPFFVTSSLDYAIQYMSLDTANGDKPTNKKNGKFVACKLSKNVKVFDLTNKDDYAKLHLPKIIQMLLSKKVNAWAAFWYLVGSKLQLRRQLDSNMLQEIADRMVHKIIELRQFKLSADDVRQLREWLLDKIDSKHLYAFELKDDNLDRSNQYKIIAQMFFNDIAKLGYDACMNDEDGAIALAIFDITAIDIISAKFMTYDNVSQIVNSMLH